MTIDKFKFGDSVDAFVVPNTNLETHISERFGLVSIWDVEHWRKGKLLSHTRDRNICVNEGLDDVLDVYFSSGTQITAWYIAPFEDNHTPAAGDTYAVPGYTESTAYDEATRQAWTEAGPSSRVITNSASKASLTFNATKTIYGAALVGGGSAATTKGDTAGGGTLFCESQFTSGSKPVVSADVLKITVTLTISEV
jgi:hypothetical protein